MFVSKCEALSKSVYSMDWSTGLDCLTDLFPTKLNIVACSIAYCILHHSSLETQPCRVVQDCHGLPLTWQHLLGHPRTSQDVPDLEAVLGPRVPGPRCPGIYQNILECPRPGGSVKSQSPKSKKSWDIQGHLGMSQTWRHAVLSPRVPGPRCPRIYQDIPECPRPGD